MKLAYACKFLKFSDHISDINVPIVPMVKVCLCRKELKLPFKISIRIVAVMSPI